MKRLLAAVIIISGTVFVPVFASARQTREASKGQGLMREIAAKLLYDGLNLSVEQRRQLVALGERARSLRTERQGADATALLEQARDEVYRTGTISAETRQALIDRKKSRGQAKERPRLREDLKSILTEEQISFMKEFDPMKQLGLPARHGRQQRGEKLKRRIRSLSDEEYRDRKQRILDRAAKRLSDKENREERIEALGRKLDTFRHGSDEEIRRLAEESPRLSRMGKKRQRRMAGKRQRRNKIRLLLSPEFQRLLTS